MVTESRERIWYKGRPSRAGLYWVYVDRVRIFYFEVEHGWCRHDNLDNKGNEYPLWCANPMQKAVVETFGEPLYWTELHEQDIPAGPHPGQVRLSFE